MIIIIIVPIQLGYYCVIRMGLLLFQLGCSSYCLNYMGLILFQPGNDKSKLLEGVETCIKRAANWVQGVKLLGDRR